jgi:hypothetical protein
MWLALSLNCYKWYQNQPSNPMWARIQCGLDEDIGDLSGGDCDASNSEKCVMCAWDESHIGHILGQTNLY